MKEIIKKIKKRVREGVEKKQGKIINILRTQQKIYFYYFELCVTRKLTESIYKNTLSLVY